MCPGTILLLLLQIYIILFLGLSQIIVLTYGKGFKGKLILQEDSSPCLKLGPVITEPSSEAEMPQFDAQS